MNSLNIHQQQGIQEFQENVSLYDSWFDCHPDIFQIELKAIKNLLPLSSKGLEIGSGTGRFAVPLSINFGIEPSWNMAKVSRLRDLKVCQSIGQELPFRNESMDFALLVTVICFIKPIGDLFREVRRVLKPGGKLVLAFIEKQSGLGARCEMEKSSNPFYRNLHLRTLSEVQEILALTGFVTAEFSTIHLGDGKNGFCVGTAQKGPNGCGI